MSNEIITQNVKSITTTDALPVDIAALSWSNDELFNALGSATPIHKSLGEPIPIKGHIVGKTNVTDVDEQTGEVKEKTLDVLYLFTDEKIYFTLGGTLIRRYLQLVNITGLPHTWKEPKHLIFTKEMVGKKQVYNVQIKIG